MSPQTLDLFSSAVNDIANGPRLNSFQDLTEGLLRRLSEKGLTLEQCADRRMLNRSASTLKGHCTKFGIRFPDFVPTNMRTQLTFIPSGDYLELTGDHVAAVAKALGIVITERAGVSSCALPRHAWEGAKPDLRAAGFEGRIGKAAKKAKAVPHG